MNTRAHWRLILGIFAIFLSFGVAFTLATTPGQQRHAPGLPASVTVPVHPVSVLVTARSGGVVAEVLHKPGDHVAPNALLLRLQPAALASQRGSLTSALRIARAALQSSKQLAHLPPSVRSALLEVHPEVTAAEDRYVQAVAALDRLRSSPSASPQAEAAWKQASLERIQVRERLGHSLSAAGPSPGLPALVSLLLSRIGELDRSLADADVRAPATAVVDILDLSPGTHLLPGSPAAVLLLPGEFFAEFPLPVPAAAHLSVGAESAGTFPTRPGSFRWRIESLTPRTIPIGLRGDRHVTQETLVRARFSAPSLPPGSLAVLALPSPRPPQ